MANGSMAFWEALGQRGGEDCLRSRAERVLEQWMDFEVPNRIGGVSPRKLDDPVQALE